MTNNFEGWKVVERPGYLGKMRDEVGARWDKQFGSGKWKVAYEVSGVIVPREMGIQMYEDGYYEFLKKDFDLRNWLVENSSDVYDTAPTNVLAGFSYDVQETPNNHIHDVAIRRAVARLGGVFRGKEPLNVRSSDSRGWVLSPCNVPFHLPNLIYRGEIKDSPGKGAWWLDKGIEDSVEEFYQQNKVLLVSI